MRSLVLILIASVLVLSGLSLEANESANSESIKSSAKPPSTRNKQKNEPKKKSTISQSEPSAPAKSLPLVAEPAPEPKKSASNDKAEQSYYDWFWPPVWSNWALVLVAIGAARIALRTLKVIELQADAAMTAATAALKEAESIVASERAYVFAKVEVLKEKIINPEGEVFVTKAKALFWNHGKTPAIILNMSGALYLTNEVPHQFLPTPVDDRQLQEGLVIASELGHQLPIDLNLTDQDIKDIIGGTKKLYCAGFIKYKDILGNERETGYCWEYRPPRERRFKFCDASRLNYYT